MISFPNCKINLGLNVLRRRQDGFHDLESVFVPLNWCDALEIIEQRQGSSPFEFSHSGLNIAGNLQDNLIYKAWSRLSSLHKLPALRVHLHKHIPMGAGLGGGSSDAAFFLTQVNRQFGLGMSLQQLGAIAAELGSDCPFFILNKPALAQGRGELLMPVELDLSSYFILLVFPAVHSDTRTAFSHLSPAVPPERVGDLIRLPVQEWREKLVNDFEEPVFARYPHIRSLKQQLYDGGALYASMSGSGSAVFGIFSREPNLQLAENYSYYLQRPASPVL